MKRAVLSIVLCFMILASLLTAISGCSSSTSNGINFPDHNLEAVIREAIGKPSGTINASDLEVLTSLDARKKGIRDLTGLERCTNLAVVQLDNNNISNIAPLAGLVNITSLSISHNQVSDISTLTKLTNLTALDTAVNQINNISALSGLINLITLRFSFNQVSDISPLSNLSNIKQLMISFNQISNITILSGFTNLRWLDLSSNKISDIEPLVKNAGIMTATYQIQIELKGNPLSERSLNVYIPQLRDKHIEVYY
jgi:internalin A